MLAKWRHVVGIINGNVDRTDGIFSVDYIAEVDVSPQVLANAILNYEEYVRLSPLVESISFSQAATDFPRVDVKLRICVLYLCRSVNKLTDVMGENIKLKKKDRRITAYYWY